MRKNGEIWEAGCYRLRLFREETRLFYQSLSCDEGVWARYLRHMLPSVPRETKELWEAFGLDPEKISVIRTLSEPDEKGEVLFLCVARICAELLQGSPSRPRESVEVGGLSLIFVGEREEFYPQASSSSSRETELRFVIPLSFDGDFFAHIT